VSDKLSAAGLTCLISMLPEKSSRLIRVSFGVDATAHAPPSQSSDASRKHKMRHCWRISPPLLRRQNPTATSLLGRFSHFTCRIGLWRGLQL
jgi:hypothetical protein